MPSTDRKSLWNALHTGSDLRDRFLASARERVLLTDVCAGSVLGGRAADFRGRSVVITTNDQFTTALALIELDGIARQLILCPPDLPAEQVSGILESVHVDIILSDRTDLSFDRSALTVCEPSVFRLLPTGFDRSPVFQTEWILLTSGTTGRPKMVVHTLATLAGAYEASLVGRLIWSTFYDIRRYGGLQIFLRAILSGGSLVLSSADESIEDFLKRVAAHNVTHISGTPSHWRKALMTSAAWSVRPQYVRLSGEIADQAILDGLKSLYPEARISHAFASTEAGLAFDVTDGFAGFPASFIGRRNGVDLKVVDGTLRIRSPRNAARFLGSIGATLADSDGFIDTADEVELRDDRYYFVGRRDGVINVGGLKVHPEEVESVINRHQQVRMSLVRMRKNPITGALVVADVILRSAANSHQAS